MHELMNSLLTHFFLFIYVHTDTAASRCKHAETHFNILKHTNLSIDIHTWLYPPNSFIQPNLPTEGCLSKNRKHFIHKIADALHTLIRIT